MSSGTYAGIAVGCVVVVALMIGMACFMNKGKGGGDDHKLGKVLSLIHSRSAQAGERPSAGFEHWQAVSRPPQQFRPYLPPPPSSRGSVASGSSNGSAAGDHDRRPSVQMHRISAPQQRPPVATLPPQLQHS